MQVSESLSRDILRLIVWFPLRWTISVLPARWGFFILKTMGDLHFSAGREKKAVIAHKIKTLLNADTATAGEETRKYLENHYIDRLHIFIYPKLTTREKIEKFVYFENIDVLDRALASGKGVILVQPHFGPVQITLLALSLYGYAPMQIGYPSDKGLSRVGRSVAFRYRLKYEAMLPPIMPADRFLGNAYKHLKKGGVILTTGDGAGGGVYIGEHKPCMILGKERLIPLGPASWSAKTGAAFIPTFVVPERYDRYRIVFDEPITGDSGDYEKDRIFMTGEFVEVAEKYIRKHPCCWHFWDEI
jgi:KDO2-lipid IV(A) lauroyltransferase